MANAAENNKRIAKNTLLLYVRMLFLMAVGFYTSRVVLQTLGVKDFGIYNVVGGVVAMLGFLQGSLGSASSRYITYDLGKGDLNIMKKTFGNIITIHLLFAGLIFILGETIGLWFMMNKLNIPIERHSAAMWVYQFSIFTSMMSIVSVPYNASIIAHEKMSAFAYISIYEAIAKLIIVYLLQITHFDKLIFYAILIFIIQCSTRIIYSTYCYCNFKETKAKLSFDKKLFHEIFVFVGWTMNGNLAVMGFTQGLNILLNLFFGPAVNAARGVAVQVQNMIQQFCVNFQMALNPQITKSYAQNNISYMHTLIITSSKFSFFLLFLISLPIIFEANFVLHVWLGIVPEHTVNFIRLILCSSMLNALANPIKISVHATGHLKKFQIYEGTTLLLIVPVAYILLKYCSVPPESVFIVHICFETIAQYIRLRIVLPMIGMKMKLYFSKVIVPLIKVILLSPILPLIVYHYYRFNVFIFFIVSSLSCISTLFFIFFCGCSSHEKKIMINQIRKRIKK